MNLSMDEIAISGEGVYISNYLAWMKKGQIETGLDFQRNFVWSAWRKSNLIMSTIIGLYIPPISVYRPIKGSTVKKVIDGKQRLTTIQQFAENMFPLDISRWTISNFIFGQKEYNKEYFQGLFYRDLPEELQERFLNKNIKMEVISGASDELAEVLFTLMNTGVEALKPQEVRLASMGKKIRNYFNGLKECSLFNHAALSEKQKQNNVQHDILAQISLLLSVGACDLSSANVDGYINQFRSTGLSEELQNRIAAVINYLSESVDIIVKHKKETAENNGTKGRKVDPNKPVKINYLSKLHMVSLAIMAEIAIEKEISPIKFSEFMNGFFGDQPVQYKDASSSKTSDESNVKKRLEAIQQGFREFIRELSKVA